MGVPVLSRVVPPLAAQGVIARLAAWAVAAVGASAIAPGSSTRLTFALMLLVLVGSSMTSSNKRDLRIAGIALSGASVLVPAASAATAVARAFPSAGGLTRTSFVFVVAAAAALTYARALVATARSPGSPRALDRAALALGRVGAWLAIAAGVVRLGGEAEHFHRAAPALSAAGVVLAGATTASAATLLFTQARFVERLYRGEATPFRIAPATGAETPPPPLSSLAAPEVALVFDPSTAGPYRSRAATTALAGMPSTGSRLVAGYRARARVALFGAGLVALSAATLLGPISRAAHGAPPHGTARELPARCLASSPVRLVALGRMSLLDVDQIAARYAALGVPTSVDRLALSNEMLDVGRGQIVAEAVLEAAAVRLGPRPGESVVVLTDIDMFARSANWRYAFAWRAGRMSVVSVARMSPAFPWYEPAAPQPKPGTCDVELRGRAYKMITRQLAFLGCGPDRSADGRSIRTNAILSLDDLDQIDEATF